MAAADGKGVRQENEATVDLWPLALKRGPSFLIAGAETVERPFGSIKQWMYQGRFLTRARVQIAPRAAPRRRSMRRRVAGLVGGVIEGAVFF